ncbi:HNH endonuclease signature motif containing protein, partial [Pseudonocardia adelaidensis]|uniref:HNH endonuclease signature motif containing protein n=1 Tax=Pseudonocardia adelaidensis TaxID=648754 RepID=UPI0031E4FC36
AGYQWLTRLALGCGKDDPRGMDARRADLAAALLSGRLTNAAPDPGSDTDADSDSGAATDEGADEGADADTDTDTDAGGSGDADDEDCGEPVCDAQASAAGEAGGSDDGAEAKVAVPRPVNPGKPLVQILIPFTTLLGADDHPCELVGHGPIPADLAREIAGDATLKRLVYDPLSGTVLDHGRSTYRPPAGLADHVRARDVYCRGPICRRRALDGHLDHITPYPHGPTNDKNLHGCCGHEHRMKHAPGWAVRALPDGRIQWITPTGHRYHSHPHDYRTDDEMPPDKTTTRNGLPKDLAARLEHIQRARGTTALRDGEAIPDDGDELPPF